MAATEQKGVLREPTSKEKPISTLHQETRVISMDHVDRAEMRLAGRSRFWKNRPVCSHWNVRSVGMGWHTVGTQISAEEVSAL